MKTPHIKSILSLLLAVALPSALQAANFTWAGSGNWTTPTNWMGSAAPANDGSATVSFVTSPAPSSFSSVVDTPYTLHSLTIATQSGGTAFNISGATLTFEALSGTAPSILLSTPASVTNIAHVISNNIVLNSSLNFTLGDSSNSGRLALAGDISGVGGIVIGFTTGQYILSGSNSFSGGVSMSRGTLNLGSNHALGTGGLSIRGTGNFTVRSVNGNSTSVWSSGTRSLDNALVAGLQETTGGTQNALTSFDGNFVFKGGVLLSGNSRHTKYFGAAANSTLVIDGDVVNDTSAEGGGDIVRDFRVRSGVASPASAGTLIINGDGNYTGATLLGTGSTTTYQTTVVNGDLSSSSNTEVFAGNTLSGTGRLSNVTVHNGGVLGAGSAGSGIGTLNISGSAGGGLDILDGGTVRLDLQSGGVSDTISLDGGVFSIAEGSTLALFGTIDPGAIYTLFTFSAAQSNYGAFSNITLNGVAYDPGSTLVYGENSIRLIPEPGSVALLMAGGLGLLVFRRNRVRARP